MFCVKVFEKINDSLVFNTHDFYDTQEDAYSVYLSICEDWPRMIPILSVIKSDRTGKLIENIILKGDDNELFAA